jgi:hypothetical protein
MVNDDCLAKDFLFHSIYESIQRLMCANIKRPIFKTGNCVM